MPTIAVRFPGGRYHATPWGHHVNEGIVEWPPSPWRILRALLAVGFNKLGWKAVPDGARGLLYTLAQTIPSYRLPAGEVAHTRHYMPVIEGPQQTTTKVFDTFIRLSPQDELLIQYPCELSPDQRAVLDAFLTHLNYLGRAESWAEARLVPYVAPDDRWCCPCEEAAPLPPRQPGAEQVALIAPLSPPEYDTWRAQAVDLALAQARQGATGRLTRKQEDRITGPYPPDLLASLLADTAFHQRQGWSQPPGSRMVLYSRSAGCLERRPARPVQRRSAIGPVEAVMLALTSDTVRGNVLPLVTRCLPQAELLHQALISHLGQNARACPCLTGRDRHGRPLVGHIHAHYVPLDLDEDGRLDHVLVHAPMGLDAAAQRAVAQVRRTWTKGGDKDIFVTCVGMGDLDLFRKKFSGGSGQPLAVLGRARVWSSFTPFVPPRHVKKARHCVEDQVRAELASRGLPPPVVIEFLHREEMVRRRLLRFIRARRPGKPQPPRPTACGLRLTFDQVVQGPLALGYAAHYGLGVFAAESGL